MAVRLTGWATGCKLPLKYLEGDKARPSPLPHMIHVCQNLLYFGPRSLRTIRVCSNRICFLVVFLTMALRAKALHTRPQAHLLLVHRRMTGKVKEETKRREREGGPSVTFTRAQGNEKRINQPNREPNNNAFNLPTRRQADLK